MGGKKEVSVVQDEAEPRKIKEVCCEKYLKKGRRCKSCPDGGLPIPPVKGETE